MDPRELFPGRDIILFGLSGSRAYGLETPESDYDWRGIYVAPNHELLGLSHPQEQLERKDPDTVIHEVGKFFRLGLNANPNILELLFLDSYALVDERGRMILENRELFLSQKVRVTYRGYAMSQLERVRNAFLRGEPIRQKHVRHCLRLLRQGLETLESGTLSVRVSDPEFYISLGALSFEEVTRLFQEFDARYDSVRSSLPEEPNFERANQLLLSLRLK